MRLIGTCLLLTLLLSPLIGAPRKNDQRLAVQGDIIVVVRSLPCKVLAPTGADLYFWSYPGVVKADASDNLLTINAAPKGSHKVSVQMVTIDFEVDKEGKTKKKVSKETAEIEVNIGDQPKPPPDPTPDGPLVKSLKAAYTAETSPDKAKHLEALSALYRQAAKMDLSTVKTAGDLYSKLSTASRALLPAEAMLGVRKVLGAELKTVLPSTVDTELTSEQRQRVQSLFARLGDALMEAGK